MKTQISTCLRLLYAMCIWYLFEEQQLMKYICVCDTTTTETFKIEIIFEVERYLLKTQIKV